MSGYSKGSSTCREKRCVNVYLAKRSIGYCTETTAVKYLILYRNNSSEVSDTVQKQQRNIWYYTESAARYLVLYRNSSEVSKQQRNIWYYTESAAKYLILCKSNIEV